ncbi:TIR domain-containing protein [Planctomycetota bacterium]|nr:TIR domain-containing protein [Planctomycetota bacterium]
MGEDSYDVFLSRAREDARRVFKLMQRLEQSGVRVWVAPDQVEAGSDLPLKGKRALAQARFFLACVSRRYAKSRQCQMELRAALALEQKGAGLTTIPVMVDPDLGVPDGITSTVRLDPTSSEEVAQLVRSLRPEKSGEHRQLGGIHIHIDGARSSAMLSKIGLEDPYKVNTILASLAGPQRRDCPTSYKAHTPTDSDKRETFDFFSSKMVDSRKEAIETLRPILGKLSKRRGVVVEVERVIASISSSESDAGDLYAEQGAVASIRDDEVGFEVESTLPVEIHHGVDVPKCGFSFDAKQELGWLMERTAEPLRIGGWFLFDKHDYWAFRSNMFAAATECESLLKEGHAVLRELLRERHNNFRLWSIAERVLGVWKAPFKQYPVQDEPDIELAGQTVHSRTPRELAQWEKYGTPLTEFWVVSPDFLGDRHRAFLDAMVRNLSCRKVPVSYTYFVHTFAEVRRVRLLVQRLAEQVGAVAFDQIEIVWMSPSDPNSASLSRFANSEFFVANPCNKDGNRQAYRLVRRNGVIDRGTAMKLSDLDEILPHLLAMRSSDPDVVGVRLKAEPQELKPATVSILFTDLERSTARQNEVNPRDWQGALERYDNLVAESVSRSLGEVVKGLGDGYLLVFSTPEWALRCAIRLQKRLAQHNATVPGPLRLNPQRVALDSGTVLRVRRAHGFDYTGEPIRRCAKLINKAHDGARLEGGRVFMTRQFREALGSGGGFDSTLFKSRKDVDLEQFGVTKLVEYLWSEDPARLEGGGTKKTAKKKTAKKKTAKKKTAKKKTPWVDSESAGEGLE